MGISRDEIRKALYKENTKAIFVKTENNIHTYMTAISLGTVFFDIPDKDIRGENGERMYNEETDAKYLGRWIRMAEWS